MKTPILILIATITITLLPGCVSVQRETPDSTTSVTTVTPGQRSTTVTSY